MRKRLEKELTPEEMILFNNQAISSIAQVNESLMKKEMTAMEMILANNDALTKILRVNGSLYNRLNEEEYNSLKKDEKKKNLINFPTGYISTLDDCEETYHLSEIIREADMARRAAYCIEVGDLYQYMTERFKVFGSVENMVYMQWYTSKMSAIEAMIIMSARHLGVSEALLSQDRKETLRNILKNEEYKNLVNLTDEKEEQLHKLFDRRNNIHLIPLDSKEKSLKFGLKDVEEAETVLKDIAELLNNAMLRN